MDVSRLLRPLGLLTLASLVLAGMALLGERSIVRMAQFEKLLPAYAANIDAARQLTVTHGRGLSGTQGISLSRGEAGWQLTQRWNYPANDELVTETLLALADIELLEARTAQKDWHRALGLVAPEQLGKAIRFEVRDGDNTPMARILIGKEEKSEVDAVQKIDDLGVDKSRFYVRLEDEAQSWLALGRVPRNPEAAAWIDPSLPRHARARLQEIAVGTNSGTNGDTGGFKAVRVGEAWSMPGAARWLDGFSALRPDDVARADSINFDTGRPIKLIYDDGLVITYENVGAATVIWSRMSAMAAPDAGQDARDMAARINARFGGWALRFSAERTPILLAAKSDFQR